MKKLEKTFNKLNNFWLYIIEFVLSLTVVLLSFSNMLDIVVIKDLNLFKLIITSLFLIILIIFCIFLFKKVKNKYENLFVLIAIPLFLMYCIFVLPNQIADEPSHIYKAYDVMSGNVVMKKNEVGNMYVEIPNDFKKLDRTYLKTYEEYYKEASKKTNWNEKTISVDKPVASYLFLAYLIPGIGLKIGELFSVNFLIAIYIGRILNIILYLYLGYLIIKKIPFGKLLFLAYLLNPMLIHETASFSADGFLNVIALLFIAFIFEFKYKKEEIKTKNIIMLLFLLFLIGTVKYLYCSLALLFLLLIFDENGKFNKKRLLWFVLGSLFVFVIVVLQFKYNYSYTPLESNTYNEENGISTIDQLKLFLSNPLIIFKIIIDTLQRYLYIFVVDFAGKLMGWRDIITSTYVTFFYYIILFHSIFIDKTKLVIDKLSKYTCFISTFVTLLLILFAFYLFWTPVGGTIVLGIQSRYFIPFLVLLFIPLLNNKQEIKTNKASLIYTVALIAINVLDIIYISKFFIFGGVI